jgi:hypothetical protein
VFSPGQPRGIAPRQAMGAHLHTAAHTRPYFRRAPTSTASLYVGPMSSTAYWTRPRKGARKRHVGDRLRPLRTVGGLVTTLPRVRAVDGWQPSRPPGTIALVDIAPVDWARGSSCLLGRPSTQRVVLNLSRDVMGVRAGVLPLPARRHIPYGHAHLRRDAARRRGHRPAGR